MRYLGTLRGAGRLTCGGEAMGRVDYEFDGFVRPAGEIDGSGEIRMPSGTLKEVFGRKDVQLQTDGGRVFILRFSHKKLPPASTAAHVDLMGDLLTISDWHN
ncbi:MAG: hypothetical protein ACK4Z4_04535 [Ferrovibrio sp.]